MSNIVETLSSLLAGDKLSQISKSVGGDEEQTTSAIGMALPAIIAAMSKKASTNEGAESMFGAMQRDQHQGLLDNLGDLLGGSSGAKSSDGAGILGHIFGSKQSSVESGISKSSGLSSGASGKLMKILAPIVMGAVAKRVLGGGGSGNAKDLSGYLAGESESVEKKSPGLLGRFLDQDGDGDFDFADVAKLGFGMLFKRK